MPKPITAVRALRARLELNQDVFWKRVGVTQSGGSRYESGRRLPAPVRILVDIAYGTPIQAQRAIDRLRPGAVMHIASKYGD